MVVLRHLGRMGMLAVGLGLGAAWAHMPIAAADTSSNNLSSAIDSLLSGASPAATTSDFQISFNGMDLLPTAGNDAYAFTTAGQYGLAIAYGDGARAYAEGGLRRRRFHASRGLGRRSDGLLTPWDASR